VFDTSFSPIQIYLNKTEDVSNTKLV